jgi:hypothetical protein
MRTSYPLVLEPLEDRLTPAFAGAPWPDAEHLTLSFAPDGTVAGDSPSVLFQTLNARAPTAAWQSVALRAFQTWAVTANINFGLVGDQGEPLGAVGRPQGDPRFGDIRLAAYPMSGEVVAVGSPFDPVAGTYSGDVKLNSTQSFGVGGAGQYDLFTVLLHETGHALGLGDSTDPTSVMYDQYLGPRTGLSASDISAVQALYGSRAPDAYEGTAGNGSFATATPLNLLTNPDGTLGVAADADISSLQDADVYRFQAPLTLGSLKIRIETAGTSLLTPRVTVYNAWQQPVASAVGSGPLGADLVVTLPSYQPLGTYYVKVQSGTADVFGVGSYRLDVQSIPLVGTLTNVVTTTTQTATGLLNNDLHTNDTILTASLLSPLYPQTSSYFNYAYKASISDRYDVDYYRIQAPQAAAGAPVVMTVMVWGLDNNGLLPAASVYDAAGNLVSAAVLGNENGTFTLQVANATPGATYYVKVQAADPNGQNNVGNYFLGIEFGPRAVQPATVTSQALNATSAQSSGSLTLAQSTLVHLIISANAPGQAQTARVQVTVYDGSGTALATATARDGLPASLTTFLKAGVYLVRVQAFTTDGSPLLPLTFTLQALWLSDPIGPQEEDPTQNPQPAPTSTGSTSQTPPPSTTTSGTSTGSTSSSSTSAGTSSQTTTTDSYSWSYDEGSGVSSENPSGNPYTTA